uniref:2-amino-4-hydroxy-6-hydroxymethyldihydropteridine pyrophosphokinase n=1 Tax=Candidatus Kentrum sp. DK TaxID=2126562 RepID=A0A450T7Q4_9GAMM|nr:MAG: 2-amino-4-hydroxy-6-hydroxymethyldihydropteridinediphosphokinase [Candidatus Kentron sp. DK]
MSNYPSNPACIGAYIGVGANLGDPVAAVRSGIRALGEMPETRLKAVSNFYRSPPMGPADQPDYINAVAAIETTIEPLALLSALQDIENRHGRVRNGPRWGPRTLDLDILLYGDRQITEEKLTVPHPGLPERAFVLYPLYEIAPCREVPGQGPVWKLLMDLWRGPVARSG